MKIKSKTRFSDTVTLSSGAKTMTLDVDVDLLSLSSRLRKARESLAEAQLSAVKDPSPENTQAMGQAIRLLFSAVFGHEQTEKCADFYADRPEAMLEDLIPYVLRKIAPMAERISKNRRRELARQARKIARRRK